MNNKVEERRKAIKKALVEMRQVEERRKAIKKAVVEMRQSLRTLDCDNKENRLNYIQYDLIKITKLADKALGQIRPAARKEAIDHKN